jgi:hypothetical protein
MKYFFSHYLYQSTITNISFNKTLKTVISKNNMSANKSLYLGYPKDETEWLKYEGCCSLFSGIVDGDGSEPEEWQFESEEVTKLKLIEGLKAVGVVCQSVTISWANKESGVRHCKCICYYNKPYQPYKNDFYIKGLSEYPPYYNSVPLEFGLSKLIL